MTSKYQLFWKTMELCGWEYEGDDDQVLKLVIKYLIKQEDSVIFKFDDLMSELLYGLDTEELFGQCQEKDPKIKMMEAVNRGTQNYTCV